MRRILYISGTRADYGLMRQALLAIKKCPGLKLEVVVCGMHLMPEFGMTVRDVIKDRFRIHKVYVVFRGDNKESMASFTGEIADKFSRLFSRIKPDIVLILGDRAEALAAAVVATYLAIPIVHIHGGEVTSTVDENSRHAITKLAHLHLAATAMAAKRIVRMGEDPWRVRVVGSPGVDALAKEKFASRKTLLAKYGLNASKPILLVIQHPVTSEIKLSGRHMQATMDALKELGHQAIVIYPNADAGGRRMIEVMNKYKIYPFIKIYKNIPRSDYLGLMKTASVMVGNSSSAIIEAPYFGLMAVNIGTRQSGRQQAGNIINVGYTKKEIRTAIRKALRMPKLTGRSNPYSRKGTAAKIADILARLVINPRLLQKKMRY